LNAEWLAIYVDVASRPELNPANRERIGKTLLLAEELGAHTITLTGRSIPEVVLGYARKHNVTKIVVGKPVRPRWREWLRGSVVDQLVYASDDIDVYVISARADLKQATLPAEWRPHRPFERYLYGFGLVALSTMLGLAVRGNLEPTNLVMLYLASTVIAAILLGRGPSLRVVILSVLAFDFFLIPQFMTFAVSDTQYLLTFTVMLVVSLVVSTLTVR
jgi:two-component system sensor histidine kinase KdpD